MSNYAYCSQKLIFANCLLVMSTALAAACGDSDATGGNAASGATNATGSPASTGSSGVCLLHACKDDSYCDGCSDGRNTCDVASGRCVACSAGTSTGCPEGFECSSFGNCVPIGATCPTDGMGKPTNPCQSSADCVACDPAHQVCDPATRQCVACTATDTSQCLQTDRCEGGKCVPRCPATCDNDNHCAACGSASSPAKGCNAHKCSECSPTYACPAGETCTPTGTCEKVCGLTNAPGICNGDPDCGGCGMGYTCKLPINGGQGVCIPPAAGCADLGMGQLALPAPWNQYTQTCSNDANCDNVSIDYNIGGALRDLTGLSTEVISDANLKYGMNVCADIEILNASCGLCVPCRVDTDCDDIDVDMLSADLFPGLSGLAVAVLLDQIFGPNPHKIFFYCESVAAGYGVCAPCPGLLNDCGVNDAQPMNCPADVTAECCQAVCSVDAFCCDASWDSTCEGEEAQLCSGNPCPHSACEAGAKLAPSCDACVEAICMADPWCCNNAWDSQCVNQADMTCGGCAP